MTKEFNKLEEIEKYYNKETNTYIFKEDGNYINTVIFNFNLYINANIDAIDIKARDIGVYDINADNIKARDIKARDIIAFDIKANNINANKITYYGVCFAIQNIKCKSIKGRRENAKHFVLDGKLEVDNESIFNS